MITYIFGKKETREFKSEEDALAQFPVIKNFRRVQQRFCINYYHPIHKPEKELSTEEIKRQKYGNYKRTRPPKDKGWYNNY